MSTAKKLRLDILADWLRTLSLSDYLLGLAAVIAFSLRFSQLSSAPYGLDADQSIILYWAQKNWEAFQLRFYGPEFTHWELLPGIVYFFFYKLSGIYRFGPAVLGILECFLIYFLARKMSLSRRESFIASLLLLCCPWHFYFSRIVGTCFGLALFWMFSFTTKSQILRLISDVLGFFYYTAYRAVLLTRFLWALLRPRPRLSWFLATLLTIFTALAFSQEWNLVLTRGSHILEELDYPYALAYFSSLTLWFFPPLSIWFPSLVPIMEIDISQALVEVLGAYETPFGWIISLLGLYGVILSGRSLFRRASTDLQKQLLLLLAASLVTIGISPSYSHFLFLVPAFILFAVQGWKALPAKKVREFVLVLGLIESLFVSNLILNRLKESDFSHDIFSNRVRIISERISDLSFQRARQATQLVTAHTLIETRFWSQQLGSFSPLSPLPARTAKLYFAEAPKDQEEQVLVFENPDLVHVPAYRTDMLEALQTYKEMIALVRTEAQILKTENIEYQDQVIATAYLVRWP